MSYQLPPEILEISARILRGENIKTHQQSRATTSALYKEKTLSAQGETRELTESEQRTYLAARMPATYAANCRSFEIILGTLPQIDITSVLDLGAGPGTASMSALKYFPDIKKLTVLERSDTFLNCAEKFLACYKKELHCIKSNLTANSSLPEADLVIASYAINEIHPDHLKSLLTVAWASTKKILIIVEPGTKIGFQNILKVREILINLEAYLLAPCPHPLKCPMQEIDKWCHFRVRFNRSKLHQQIKLGTLNYEDEPFSFVAFCRDKVTLPTDRLTSFPKKEKGFLSFESCTSQGEIAKKRIMKRNKEQYNSAKDITWGDGLVLND
jgi:ribosomal protein RSM22 (predicted rRNA methylase)